MKSFFYGLLCLFIMLVSVPAFAQIGIGTKTPAPSAALEVTSSTNNKGILIPRVTATQKNAIASPAEGLLVYQTTAPIGFYYYTGGAWKLMAIQTDLASKVDKVNGKDLSSNDYTTTEKTKLLAITGTNTGDQTTITGNAGTATKLASPRTINGVAFDGTANITVTADAGTLTGSFTKDITVNSVNIGRGNGVNGSNTRIGGQALTSNTSGYENVAIGDASLSKNTTGGRNNAIGASALFKNTTGSENTAIGTYALENNINGNRNLAIGQQTLFTNTEGIKNVALGYVPLYSNTTGSNNNAIGDETLFYNTTGNHNIGIGSQAGLTISTGSQNTMIGAQADVASGALTNATALGFGAKVATSNTIQLGNTNVTNVKTSGTVTAAGFTSTVATGTAPLVVTSTTPVANLSIGGNAATVTTNANLTGPVTSVGNATTITDGAITTASIADGAITNAKVTDVAASKITGTFTSATVNGKVIVGASSAASSSAVLEASSTTQGFLPPRMTEAQRNAISSAVAGLVVWCSDCGSNGELQVHNGTTWKNMIGEGTASSIPSVTNPTTGKVWMDRNLGASQVATSSTDALAYGDLYQWGRGTDGHQLRTSGVTATESITDTPGNNLFIADATIASGNTAYGDWRSTTNNSLWQGVSGTNNPCPSGYRIPTETEWNSEIATWTSRNSGGAFASPLKLTLGGERSWNDGSISNATTYGEYWSSTVYIDNNSNNGSKYVLIDNTNVYNYGSIRAFGFSVRCIKN
jgi:uncharacterized protein (TIGR02145 family)